MTDAAYSPALAALTAEVQHFLFREADLVDDRRFDEWLDLFAVKMDTRFLGDILNAARAAGLMVERE